MLEPGPDTQSRVVQQHIDMVIHLGVNKRKASPGFDRRHERPHIKRREKKETHRIATGLLTISSPRVGAPEAGREREREREAGRPRWSKIIKHIVIIM